MLEINSEFYLSLSKPINKQLLNNKYQSLHFCEELKAFDG